MTEQEIDALLTNLEMQLAEYKQARHAAAEWYAAWKARRPSGFKIKGNSNPHAYQHVSRET